MALLSRAELLVLRELRMLERDRPWGIAVEAADDNPLAWRAWISGKFGLNLFFFSLWLMCL